jgi:hypothetical protein
LIVTGGPTAIGSTSTFQLAGGRDGERYTVQQLVTTSPHGDVVGLVAAIEVSESA